MSAGGSGSGAQKRTAFEIRRAPEPKLCAGFGVVCAFLCNVAGRGWRTFNAKNSIQTQSGDLCSKFQVLGFGVQGFRLKVEGSGCRFWGFWALKFTLKKVNKKQTGGPNQGHFSIMGKNHLVFFDKDQKHLKFRVGWDVSPCQGPKVIPIAENVCGPEKKRFTCG